MSPRRVGMDDYTKLCGAKPIINNWIRRENLVDDLVKAVVETTDPDVVMLEHMQRGWDGKIALTADGKSGLMSQRMHQCRKPFPFDRIDMLRRLHDGGVVLAKGVKSHAHAVTIIQNGGDPFV